MIRVLIADDAPVALGNMRRLVDSQDDMQAVGAVGDGASTVAAGVELRPDVLVVDIELSGTSGLAAARRIRSRHQACRVVVMALDDDDQSIEEARTGGADEYLIKPFAGMELLEAIRRLGALDGPTPGTADQAAAPGTPDGSAPGTGSATSHTSPTDAPAGPPAADGSAERTGAGPLRSRGDPAPPPLFFGNPTAGDPGTRLAQPKPPEDRQSGREESAAWSPFARSLLPVTPPQPPAARHDQPQPRPEAPPDAPRPPEPAGERPVPELAGPGTAVPAFSADSLAETGDAWAVPDPSQSGAGRVIVITAAKGGVGNTVIAVNLAILLAQESNRTVALLDLQLQQGDVGTLLRLPTSDEVMTLADLARLEQLGDPEAVGAALVRSQYGVLVLRSHAAGGRELRAESVHAVLGALRQACDLVIVDVPRHVGPAQIAALRDADQIVVVSGMSDPAVRATQGLLAALGELRPRAGEPLVVLNRSEANSDFTRETVEQALGRTVILQFPYDAVVVGTSVNRGTPFVSANPAAQATRRIRELATVLLPELPQPVDAPSAPEDIAASPGGPQKHRRRGLFSFARA